MLRREAASWLARVQSGRDPGIDRKFQQWHDADPRHAAAFERICRTYEQAGLLRHSREVDTARHERTMPKSQWRALPALAAAVAAISLLGLLLVRAGLPFGPPDTVMLMSAVGEIKQIELADGSKVTLDTATKVEVGIGRSRRTARLRYGRARFQVAPANAPFVVETAIATISTRQGVVDVEQQARQGRVQVLAGAADVRGSDGRQSSLGAGEGVAVNPTGAAQKMAAGQFPDWTRGMLQFDGTPVTDAVALANRYSNRRIIILGDVAALRVTGAFRAGDTTGLAKALAAAFGLSLQRHPDGNLILSRNVPPGPERKRGG